MIRSLFLALAIAGLAACAPQAGTPLAPVSVAPARPSENVYVDKGLVAAERAFTLAMQMAARYTTLPRCQVPRVERICSDPSTVREIRKRAIQANNAIDDAQRNTGTIDMALRAISLFRSVIPQT